MKVSRRLSLALRHHPDALGLTLDESGWARVVDVQKGLAEAGLHTRYGELAEIVASNDKSRFSFGGAHDDMIRANQGHSIEVLLQLEPAIPPGPLYHGTSSKVLGPILHDGLVRMKRHHVHLSADLDTALKVGERRGGETVILQVDTAAMIADHLPFFRSENGVWLVEAVPPAYLTLIS